MFSWMGWLKGRGKGKGQRQLDSARRSIARRSADRRRPALEVLEDRLAPAFNLTISTSPTFNIVVSPQGVLTAVGPNANIDVAEMQFALNNGNNIFISNGSGGAEAGNITWLVGANLVYNGAFPRFIEVIVDPTSVNGVITLNSQISTNTTLHQLYRAEGDVVINNLIDAGAGTMVLVSTDGEVRGNGAVIAADLSISAQEAITLDQNNDVTGVFAAVVAGSGQGVVFNDVNDLTIGSVGTTNPVEGVTTNNGSILITTGAGGIRVTEDIDAGAADIALRAGGSESIFRNDAVITNSGAHEINIAANRMILDGNPGTNAIIAVGGGRVILRAASANRPITLSPTDPLDVLVISDAELDSVTTTGVLQIGNGIEGNVTVNTAISPDNVDTLTITTAGGIGGGGSIAVTNLRLSAGNAVNLTGANDVDILAGEVNNAGQPFTFNGVGPLTVGTVDGVTGVSTTNAPIVITTSTGSLTVDDAIVSGLGNIVLTAGAANSANPADVLTINANVTAVSGNHITLGGNDLVVNAATVSTTGAGNVTMSFGAPGPLPAAGTAVFNTGALISVANGNIDLTAAFFVTLNGTARLQAIAGGGINITTDDITIAPSASISASDGLANGNNVVVIRNFSAGRAISLGSNANLGLTGAELDRVQAELLRLGRNDAAATGNISLAGPVNLLTVPTLHLITAAAVVDATVGELPDLLVSNLAIQARTGIGNGDDLDVAVGTVAAINTGGAPSGDIQLSNTGALIVGAVAGVNGVQRTGGSLANIAVTATTTMTVNAPVNNSTGGDVDLIANTSITLNIGAVQTTGAGDIRLTTDDLIITGSAVVTASDTVTIRNASAARPINLGANAALGITDAELDRVNANVLIVGRNDATAAGTITVSAPINLTTGGNPIPVLHLITGDAVLQGANGLLTVASLALQAGTGIGSGTPLATATATLAASSGTGVSIFNLGTLTIGTVHGVSGVSATGGNVTVISTGGNRAGAFTVAANVQTPGNITLIAQEAVPASVGDNLAVNSGVSINSTAGDVSLGAGEALTLPVGAVVQAAGAVTLTGGFGDNGHGGSVLFLGTATGASVTVSGGNGDDTLIVNPNNTIATVDVLGLAGSDTIAVTPNAATAFDVVGGDPTPPATPGDILDVELAGTTDPTLVANSTPTGLQGMYTFGNRAPINFQQIETLTSTADVAVTMTDAPDPVLAGDNITYTITVRNLGELNAQNVELLDAIPANTTFVSFTQTSGPAFTLTTPPAGGTGNVTATIDTLDAGATATFTLVVETDDALANHTVITNTATLTTDTAESTTNNTATATTRIGPVGFFAVGAAQGQRPRVAVYSRAGALIANFLAYSGNFRGGVRTAVGDVNGDGTADIITAAGPGQRQLVQVIDGTQLAALGGGRVPASALLRSFFVTSAKFKEGVFVASGDVNNDGLDDIVVGMGGGAPRVLVFDADTGAAIANFKAYANSFKEGVTVAAGDVNGDGHADIVVAPERGAQRVIVADGTALPVGGGRIPSAALLGSFFPLQPSFTGGWFVAAGDVNGDLRADIVVAPASGAAPVVKVVDATRLHQVAPNGRLRGAALLANQLVFGQSFRGGVQVGVHELDLDGMAEVLVGFGPNDRTLKAFDVITRAFELSRRVPFDAGSLGGI